MKQTITLLISLIFSISIIGQDTTYYDNNWEKVKEKEEATYYRISRYNKKTNIFFIEDFFLNGKRQMAGSYKSLNPENKHGEFMWWYSNGQSSMKGKYVDDEREGLFYKWDSLGVLLSETDYSQGYFHGEKKIYYSNGNIKKKSHYNNGLLEGEIKEWYENGQLKNSYIISNRQLNGVVESYYENGKQLRVDIYKDDKLIKGVCFTKNGSDTAYYPFFERAEFKGGINGFRKYIESKLVYPEIAAKHGKEGRVNIYFVIDTAGNLVEEEIIRSDNRLLNSTALNVVRSSPKWKPGKINGELVRMSFVFPVVFVLK
ncbi:TonB family protein [Bacteroidota bacterium]